jgi:hypothetical protein
MVGEMRDLETTEIAIRAALTGHLVFSTLHTNDAIGGITRLIDMGVEPFLVSSAVRAFFAQRLVRKLCPLCKTPMQVEESYLKSIGFPTHVRGQIMRAVGCDACRGSGFQGRLSIYEVCLVTHALQHLINSRAHPAEFHKQALKDGYIPMRGYGFQKVLSGETTIGKYPMECVQMFDKISRRIEREEPTHRRDNAVFTSERMKILHSAVVLANELPHSKLLTFTRHGFMAHGLAALRPTHAPILAFTPHLPLLRQLRLLRAVEPYLMPLSAEPDVTIENAIITLRRLGHVSVGDKIIVVTDIVSQDRLVDAIQLRTVR